MLYEISAETIENQRLFDLQTKYNTIFWQIFLQTICKNMAKNYTQWNS